MLEPCPWRCTQHCAVALLWSVWAECVPQAKPSWPYAEWSHGFTESIRFEGFVPTGLTTGRDWSYDFGRYNLSVPKPMLPAVDLTNHKDRAFLVVSDTSGIHYRGYAPPGSLRTNGKFHSNNHRIHLNPWRCFLQLEAGNPC